MPPIPDQTGDKYMLLYDVNGGAAFQMPATINSDGDAIVGNLIPSGLGTTTAGVTDSLNKRFVTDAELAALMTVTAQTANEVKLSTTAAVNLNQDPETNLYTVTTGKSCIITRVIVRLASASLTTVSISFGFNAGTDNDVIANATHTELTGNTLYTILIPKIGAKIGTSTGVFSVICNTKQGGAATVTIDVFGILF